MGGVLANLLSQRAGRRKKRSVPADVWTPLSCVTVSVDPAKSCGVALFRDGVYLDSGHGDGYEVRFIEDWLGKARWFADQLQLPLVLVLENPPVGGAAFEGRSTAGTGSVIGVRNLWIHQWPSYGRKAMRCDVYPVTWRSKVLGVTRGPTVQYREMLMATLLAGRGINNRDEAAAVCIGEWSCRAGVVASKLESGRGKKRVG
jgi:hypothetical protein